MVTGLAAVLPSNSTTKSPQPRHESQVTNTYCEHEITCFESVSIVIQFLLATGLVFIMFTKHFPRPTLEKERV